MKIMIDLDGTIFPTYYELDILHKALLRNLMKEVKENEVNKNRIDSIGLEIR